MTSQREGPRSAGVTAITTGDPALRRRGWMRQALSVCLASGLVPALTPSAAAQADTLTISTNNTPLDRKALVQLSQEALRRLGLAFRLVSQPSERSLQAANQGEVDGEGLRVAGLEAQYPQLVRVPEAYVGISFVAFAKGRDIPLDRGWDSVRQHRVAFISGWKLFEANASDARTVHKVERPEQLFEMLAHGRVDLALYTRADGLALARRLKMDRIVPLAPALKDVDMYLYLHRRHAALAPRLALALRDMKSDGSYNRILASLTEE
jgi:polar amino acid transport system substrate-binding protein